MDVDHEEQEEMVSTARTGTAAASYIYICVMIDQSLIYSLQIMLNTEYL